MLERLKQAYLDGYHSAERSIENYYSATIAELENTKQMYLDLLKELEQSRLNPN